jgi:hypothetical protein
MRQTSLLMVLFVALLSFAQMPRLTVYLEPPTRIETYLAAAIAKKGVPVDVVTDQTKTIYVLKSAPVEAKTESTVARLHVACSLRVPGSRIREMFRPNR